MAKNRNGSRARRLQSSFELLITLSLGLAILLPIAAIAFVQLSASSTSLSSIESQQAASKLANAAALIGSQGAPAKQLVQISVPPNVKSIYVGTMNNTVGHEIIFVVSTASGPSYITSYTPVNVSGSIGSLASAGTYLINITAQSACPTNTLLSCVYLSSKP